MVWFPGEATWIRLWDTLAVNGIGTLLKPWLITREGAANLELKRNELIVMAQANRDAEKIRAGHAHVIQEKGRVRLTFQQSHEQSSLDFLESEHESCPVEHLVADAANADALRKEINVAASILYAASELESDATNPPEVVVDSDWLYRWRDAAACVSSEDLQLLWGRLLAEEVKRPGSFSLRALDFVRNLSRDDAKDIQQASQFVIDGYLFQLNDLNTKSEPPVPLPVQLRLQSIGILSGVDSFLRMSLGNVAVGSSPAFLAVLFNEGRGLLIESKNPDLKIDLRAAVVSPLGLEVLQLCKSPTNREYLQKLADHFKSRGCEVMLGVKTTDAAGGSMFEGDAL